MKVAASVIPPPDLSARATAPAGRLAFKSALAEAERLVELPAPVSCQLSHRACSDDLSGRTLSDARDDLADRAESERKPQDILRSNLDRARSVLRDDQPRPAPPERTPTVQAHAVEQWGDGLPQPGFATAAAIGSRRSGIHLTAACLHSRLAAFPGSSPTVSQTGAERAAVAETPVRASTIDANRSADPQADAWRAGLHRIGGSRQSMASGPANSSNPQSQNATALAPRSAGHSIAWTPAEADRFKDDGKAPLGFAEPGVIRPLRCDIERLDPAVQQGARELRSTAAASASRIETDRRGAPSAPGDRPSEPTPPPRTRASTREAPAGRMLRFVFAAPRPSPLSTATGLTHASAPNRTIEESAAPTRASAKAPAPRPQTAAPRAPSLIFHETAGALDLIVGLFRATPDLRARLQRALDAAAADYGLRVAHITLNGASIERANGPRGD